MQTVLAFIKCWWMAFDELAASSHTRTAVLDEPVAVEAVVSDEPVAHVEAMKFTLLKLLLLTGLQNHLLVDAAGEGRMK